MKSARKTGTPLLAGLCALVIGQTTSLGAGQPNEGIPPPPSTIANSEPPAATPAPGGDAQAILQQAIVSLEALRSISAETRQYVDIYDKQLVGSGSYFEQRGPNGLELRLELRLQLGDYTSSLLQVCKGQFLWISRDKETPIRIDVSRVAKVWDERGDFPGPGRIGTWPGLGGLPKLLRGLNSSFDFTLIEETRLGEQLPAYRLQGQWKREKLAKILPQHSAAIREGKPVDLGAMPLYLAHRVVLYLEKDGLFPRRIEFRRPPPSRAENEPPREETTIVSMDLYNVVLNAPINADRFNFRPGERGYTDQTERFLDSLGLKKK